MEAAHRVLQKERDNYTDALNLTQERFIVMKREPWEICTDTRPPTHLRTAKAEKAKRQSVDAGKLVIWGGVALVVGLGAYTIMR